MRNRILNLTRCSIPYLKELQPLAGSISGCILMQQLDYWFEKKPRGFWKFLEPSDNHCRYKTGDSWTEELGMSAEEFRCAFDRIGTRYKSNVNGDLKLIQFFSEQRFKTDTPPIYFKLQPAMAVRREPA